jgi:putative endonuclease
MPSDNQQFGKIGEEIAQRYLEEQNFRSLEQNWHCRYGELDLIMQEEDELVFVEVKTRRNNHVGYPEEMIDRGKVERLKKSAEQYIEQYDKQEMFWRFDIVAISGDTQNYQVHHIRDALRED